MHEWLEKYQYDQTQSVDKEGGSVYRGQDKRNGQPLVIKVQEVHPIWDRGMLEARYQLAMQLKHPHLLPCLDAARWEGEGVVTNLSAMPLVAAGSLADKNPLEWTTSQKRDIIEAVLKAISYLHEHNLVLQNLAPQHILLSFVQDIIIPQLINYGTPTKIPIAFYKNYEYLAPEQLEETGTINPQTDIWAVGVLLFWMQTGNLPFGKQSAQLSQAKLRQNILERPIPETVNDFPQPIQKIIRGCLQKKTSQRWLSIDEILAIYLYETEEVIAEKEAEGAIANPSDPIWKRRFKRQPSKPISLIWWLLAAVLAAVLGWVLSNATK